MPAAKYPALTNRLSIYIGRPSVHSSGMLSSRRHFGVRVYTWIFYYHSVKYIYIRTYHKRCIYITFFLLKHYHYSETFNPLRITKLSSYNSISLTVLTNKVCICSQCDGFEWYEEVYYLAEHLSAITFRNLRKEITHPAPFDSSPEGHHIQHRTEYQCVGR